MLKLSLIKIEKERIKHKQKLVYKKIFSNLCNTINLNAEYGKTFCLFIIPQFISDEITYPFEDCLNYLNNKIEYLKQDKQIIEVSFFSPNVYFIKWTL